MKNFLLCGALALFMAPGLFAQSKQQADPNANYAPTRNIYQKVSVQLPSGAGSEEVIRLVKDREPLLKESGSDLQLLDKVESPGGFHYNFAQSHLGTPVYDASIKVNVTRSNRVLSFMNNLQSYQPTVKGSFNFSHQDVENHVSQNFGANSRDLTMTVAKNFKISGGELLPVFKVVTVDEHSSWEYLLDANNLNLVQKRELAVYHHRGGCVDTVGAGMVFNPDPLTTACVNYGGAYVDNGDQDVTALNNERVTVVLQDICYRNGKFWLEGPYALIADLESPTIAPTSTNDGQFNYTRAQSGFEDVMCYYHVDLFQRYVQSLGFNNMGNLPLNIDPHGLNGSDNSHFVPNGTNSRLGFGEGCVDDAEDADVIIHEYAHALSYFASPGTNSGFERQGLDEGFGDYMAASYSKNLSNCHWDDVFTWDGHNTCWPGRSASISTTYPPSSTWDFYLYGEIWASTMMEVWDVEGRAAVDAVQMQEFYFNQSNMTLNDAAHAILDADTMLFNGVHTQSFQTAFCNRGIFTGLECVVSAEEGLATTIRWDVYPNPAQQSFNINLQNLDKRGAYSYQMLNNLGQIVQQGILSQNTTEINTANLESGLYFISLQQNGSRISTQKLLIQD